MDTSHTEETSAFQGCSDMCLFKSMAVRTSVMCQGGDIGHSLWITSQHLIVSALRILPFIECKFKTVSPEA